MKKILILIMAITLMISLSACSDSNNDYDDTDLYAKIHALELENERLSDRVVLLDNYNDEIYTKLLELEALINNME